MPPEPHSGGSETPHPGSADEALPPQLRYTDRDVGEESRTGRSYGSFGAGEAPSCSLQSPHCPSAPFNFFRDGDSATTKYARDPMVVDTSRAGTAGLEDDYVARSRITRVTEGWSLDEGREKQPFDLNLVGASSSSLRSPLGVEEDSDSLLASNISDLSLGDGLFGELPCDRFQSQLTGNHSPGSVIGDPVAPYDAESCASLDERYEHLFPSSGSPNTADEINCSDYLQNIPHLSPSKAFLSHTSQPPNTSSETTNSLVLVRIKLLDSSEIPSLSAGEVPAIMVPSEDMESAKAHFCKFGRFGQVPFLQLERNRLQHSFRDASTFSNSSGRYTR